jgi:hypothetical protein
VCRRVGVRGGGKAGRDGLTDANSCAVPARIKRSRAETERECAHGYVCVRLVRESRGFDSSGVRVCICANVGGVATGATQNRRHVRDDDTETRAQRADLGEAVFRVEVAEWSELGVDGLTDTRAPVRWGSQRRHGGMSSTVTDR